MFLPCLLFGLRRPSTGDYRLFGGANGGLQEGSCQWGLPRTAAASVLCPCSEPQLPPTSAGDPPILAGRFGPVSYGFTAFFPWFLVHTRLCVHPPRMEFLFPPVCGSPAIKPRWPSKPDSLGTPPPVARPPGWEA